MERLELKDLQEHKELSKGEMEKVMGGVTWYESMWAWLAGSANDDSSGPSVALGTRA